MIRLASTQSSVDAAWSAFDCAAIRLHRMYSEQDTDTPKHRAARMALAQDVARLWDEYRALFLADGDERGTAA